MPFSFRNIFSNSNNYHQSKPSTNSTVFGYGNTQYKSNNSQPAVNSQPTTSQNPFINNQFQRPQQFYNPFISKQMNQQLQAMQNQPTQPNQKQQNFQVLFGQNPFSNNRPNRQNNQNMQNGSNRKNQNMSSLPPLMQGGLENPFSAKLPDGVTLQPIGEDMLKNLQGISLPDALPQNPNTLPKTPEFSPQSQNSFQNIPEIPPQNSDFLQQLIEKFSEPNTKPIEIFQPVETNNVSDNFDTLIQNEKNCSIYYKNLSQKSPFEFRNLLENIGSQSANRQNSFNELYKEQNGYDFSPREAEIVQNPSFRNSVILAIEEESKNIREIIKAYEKTNNPTFVKVLNAQIYEKIVDMNLLNMILIQIAS